MRRCSSSISIPSSIACWRGDPAGYHFRVDAIPWAALLVAVGTVVFGAQTPAPRPPLNGTLTDVEGVLVGHSVRRERPTGCTVVVVRDGAVAGVDVRGAAPGTRETDLLDPLNTVQQVHAIVLSGGSAFGLDVATGVMT